MSFIRRVIGHRFWGSQQNRTNFQDSWTKHFPLEPHESQTVTLPDGRTLGFSDYGSATGDVVFTCHGLPGSRVDARSFHALDGGLGFRYIGVDRPGMGLSSFQEGRSIKDFPYDIRFLASHLGIKTFKVLGASGGGPYALACARYIPGDILKATGVMYGMGPWEAGLKDMNWTQWLGWKILPNSRWLLSSLYQIVLGNQAQDPDPKPFEETLKKIFIDPLNEEEKKIMLRPDVWKDEVTSMREAVRNGTVGYAEDAIIFKRPWSFNLEDIEGRVLLFYGTADTHAPLRMGKYILERLKNGKLKSFEGETHYTLMDKHGSEILKELDEA